MTMSRTKWILLFLVLFSIGLTVGIWSIRGGSRNANEMRMGVVERGDLIKRVTIAGTIVPQRHTAIMAPYNGFVQNLYVEIGKRVRKNDPLVSVSQALGSGETVFPIRAPFEGIVVQVGRKAGEFVKENDPKDFIVRIDDLSRLFIEVNAAELDVVKIKTGQDAVIKANAVLDRSYKGIVREISLAAKEDPAEWGGGGNRQAQFPLRIEILDKDDQIKPGMSALIDIVASKKENVLKLGHEFIFEEDGKYFVTLRSGERREIKIGDQNEESFEIRGGVNEGDEIRQIDFFSLVEKTK